MRVVQTFPFLTWFPNPLRAAIEQDLRNMRTLTGLFRTMTEEHNAVTRTVDEQNRSPDYLFAYADAAKKQSSNAAELETFTGRKNLKKRLPKIVRSSNILEKVHWYTPKRWWASPTEYPFYSRRPETQSQLRELSYLFFKFLHN